MSYQSRCRPIRQVFVEDAEDDKKEGAGRENRKRLEEDSHTDDERGQKNVEKEYIVHIPTE